MINKQKQIEYWIESAKNDIETAELLIQNNKYLHGLFFCHLVIEKAVKSHVVKSTNQIPPKSHNLLFLADKTDLEISEDYGIFFGILMKYQLQGRYPDYNPNVPSQQTVLSYLTKTKDLLKWIEEQL